jgi:hypothetical protein
VSDLPIEVERPPLRCGITFGPTGRLRVSAIAFIDRIGSHEHTRGPKMSASPTLRKKKAPFRMLVAAICLLLPANTSAQSAPGEYGVKATFLLNFARLVEWPTTAFAGPRAPVTVGLMSSESSFEELERSLDGKPVGRRRVAARRISKADEAIGFHMVFLDSSNAGASAAVAKATHGHAVLLVGESEGFAKNGGAIGFFNEGNKIRFEINPRATEAAGLHVSSRLLRVARIVRDETQ